MTYEGKRFGAWLREQRRAVDMTQRELAHEIGCSEFTLRKFEAGTRRPSRQIVERLAQCFGLASAETQQVMDWARFDDNKPRISRGQEEDASSGLTSVVIAGNPHKSPVAPHTSDRP